MTLTTTNNRKDYTGNGAILIFAYDFLIVANADLGVYLDGVKKTLTTDYTVSGAGLPGGGNVTFVVAPGSGVAVSIIREVGYTQGVAYVENQKFPAATHESALDRLTMLCQQLLEKIGRAVTFKTQSLLTNPVMADGVIGKVLRWKTTTELENVDMVGSGAISVPVSVAQGGSGADLSAGGAIGDLLIADATTTLKRLPVGAKGALLVGKPTDAVKAAWKAVGTDGQTLAADSTAADGLAYVNPFLLTGSRLVFTNATTLTLNVGQIPLKVGGVWKIRNLIAAVTVSNAGLAANTTYFVYAQDSAGSTILLLSTTGHSTDTTFGVETKTGDTTQTLVGMIRTQGSTPGQFVDSATQRFTASYFSRRQRALLSTLAGEATSSLTYVEIDSTRRIEFVTWGDEDVDAYWSGSTNNSAANNANYHNLGLDNTTPLAQDVINQNSTGTNQSAFHVRHAHSPAEGYHYYTALMKVSAGTGTVNQAQVGGMIRQ